MKQTKSEQQLAQEWERAVQAAAENISPSSVSLDTAELNSVAGLYVKSGVKSGLWGVSSDCGNNYWRVK